MKLFSFLRIVLFVLTLGVFSVALNLTQDNDLAPQAQAGAITNLAISVADKTKSASTTYTVSLTNATTIPKDGGRIYIRTFGPGYDADFSKATVDSGTSPSALSIYSRNWDGVTLQTSSDIAASTAITIKLGSVKNSSKGGYYVAQVWTTQYSTNLDGDGNWGGDYKSGFYEIGSNTNVTGTASDSTGAALGFASVTISNSNYSNYYYSYSDKDGKYGFGDVVADSYTVRAYAPSSYGSGKIYGNPADSTISVASSGVTTKNLTFQAPTKTVSGKVTKDKATGTAVTDGSVSIYKVSGSGWGNVNTNSSGEYTFSVPGGTWSVSVYPKNYPGDWTYYSSYNSDNVTFKDDSSSESQTKNFIVRTLSATLTGTIKKPDGTAVPKYGASISFQGSSTYPDPSDSSKNRTDNYYFSSSLNKDDGSFSTKVVPTTYTLSGWSSDNNYSFPKVDNVTVGENETKNLGVITLSEKKDKITGTVKDNSGNGISGVSVSAYKTDGGYDWASTTTASDGSYTIKVIPGDWQVSSWPPWKQDGSDYVYTGKPTSVTVKSGVAATVNFVFQKVTATIKGTITDPDGNTLSSLSSWVSAGDGSQEWGNVGASVTNGTFTLKVPKGKWTINAYIYGADYGSPDPQTVEIGDNETKTVTLKATKNDAKIIGTIYDDKGDKITNKWISVYATKGKGGSWQNATVDQSKGTYEIKLSAGTWTVGWWVDQSLGLGADNASADVTVASGETKTYDINLKKLNATIKGKATKSDGSALQWAWITADSRDPGEKKEAYTKYYNNGASSGADGSYTMKVPAGTYWVGGNMWYGSGVINPKRQKVTVEENKEVTVDLTFRKADATISGAVKKDGSGTSAYVSAYSDGGFAEVNSNNEGRYDMSVSSGSKWNLSAVKQIDKDIYKTEKEVTADLTASTTASHDLELKKLSFTLPDKKTSTFPANQASTIELGDGTKITIPAGSITDKNTQVSAAVEPTATIPDKDESKLATDYGYDISFTDNNDGSKITDFKDNITIEMKYTDDLLKTNSITDEKECTIAYLDESTDTWRELETSTVNATENTVTAQVNHATKFAIVATADTTAPAAPKDVKATALDGKVTLTWTNPTDADFDGVNIYRSTESGKLGDKVHSKVSGTTKDDENLTNGTTYYYTLKAVDKTGNESSTSDQVSATPSAEAALIASGKLPKTGRPASAVAWPYVFGLLAFSLTGIIIVKKKYHG